MLQNLHRSANMNIKLLCVKATYIMGWLMLPLLIIFDMFCFARQGINITYRYMYWDIKNYCVSHKKSYKRAMKLLDIEG